MITDKEITLAGQFTKTHGIKGELNAALAVDVEFLEEHPMFICEMEGIYVPFFIASIRPKGSQSALIQPEDINSEQEAKLFVGKNIYILKEQLRAWDSENADEDEEGAYADDLIGYTVQDRDHGLLGEIAGIEDSTANTLLILRTPQDTTLYIPVAEPFILGIDPETRTVTTAIPDGLLHLNG